MVHELRRKFNVVVCPDTCTVIKFNEAKTVEASTIEEASDMGAKRWTEWMDVNPPGIIVDAMPCTDPGPPIARVQSYHYKLADGTPVDRKLVSE